MQVPELEITSEIESTLEYALTKCDAERDSLLVALSGGPDSTSLLLALAPLARKHGWSLYACHVNHQLRGAESDEDQRFCQMLCSNLGISLSIIQRADLENGIAISENRLREMRYRALERCARDLGAQFVLTGHTRDDQAETILFRIFRGTAVHGLSGITDIRTLSAQGDLWLVRPLLRVSKLDCQRYLAAQSILARHDSSNDELRYTRNFIRTQVAPLISERFPGWTERMSKLHVILRDENLFMDGIAKNALEKIERLDNGETVWIQDEFARQDVAIRRRIVAQALRARSIEPNYDRISEAASLITHALDGALSLSRQWEIRIDRKHGWCRWIDLDEKRYKDSKDWFLAAQLTVIRLPGDRSDNATTSSNIITWLDKSLQVELWTGGKPVVFPQVQGVEALVDLSRVSLPLIVRARLPGDTIRPFGMKNSVKLKKYLHTHKSPSGNRQPELHSNYSTIVVADQNEVIWVPQVGLSELLRVEKQPTHRLRWTDLSHGALLV